MGERAQPAVVAADVHVGGPLVGVEPAALVVRSVGDPGVTVAVAPRTRIQGWPTTSMAKWVRSPEATRVRRFVPAEMPYSETITQSSVTKVAIRARVVGDDGLRPGSPDSKQLLLDRSWNWWRAGRVLVGGVRGHPRSIAAAESGGEVPVPRPITGTSDVRRRRPRWSASGIRHADTSNDYSSPAFLSRLFDGSALVLDARPASRIDTRADDSLIFSRTRNRGLQRRAGHWMDD